MALGCMVREPVLLTAGENGLLLVGDVLFSRHTDVYHTWDCEWCALLFQACEAGVRVATGSVPLPAIVAASPGLTSAWNLTSLTALLQQFAGTERGQSRAGTVHHTRPRSHQSCTIN